MIFTLERIENKPMENKFINTSDIPLMLTIKETALNTNIIIILGTFWEFLKI